MSRLTQRILWRASVNWKLAESAGPLFSGPSLKFFYMSLGSFAAAALVSLLGSVFTASSLHLAFTFIVLLGLLSGTVGVAGPTLMVEETRLAIQNLAEEAELTARPVETP